MDDTPSFSSASNSPIPTLAGSVLDNAEVTSRLDAEYRQAHKLDKQRLPFKVCFYLFHVYKIQGVSKHKNTKFAEGGHTRKKKFKIIKL